jgi:hypothetical protein
VSKISFNEFKTKKGQQIDSNDLEAIKERRIREAQMDTGGDTHLFY